MIDRTRIKNIDWILIGLLLLNSIFGAAVIYSSSHYIPGNFYLRQMIFILVSLSALILFLLIDYNTAVTYSIYVYVFFIAVLAGILLFGQFTAGTKSWIRFSIFQVQPSELMKVVVILVLAWVYANFKKNFLSWMDIFLGTAIIGIPAFLITLQPDLGTALSFLPILLAAFILAGLKKKTIVVLLLFALFAGIASSTFFLRDYQKKRLVTLVTPGKDPLGSGYQILQSKIAIGSGGLFGKGYKKGTQSQLRFLPARHTDFIFSVVGEEFGFTGVVLATFLYILFLSRLFRSINASRDRTGVFIIFMVSMLFACQFLVNVLMTVGLFPVAGIPLPLWSYGGSSLMTNYLAVSLVINIKMRRFVNV